MMPGRYDSDLLGIGDAGREFITMYTQLHRVSHGSQLHNRHFRTGYNTHIQKVLTKGSFASDLRDDCGLSDGNFAECDRSRNFLRGGRLFFLLSVTVFMFESQ